MKYMGSKRAMLKNGLGHLIERETTNAERFVDLFTGSGAVAHFVAERFPIPVLATDLQEYGATLAAAVIERCKPISAAHLWRNWRKRAERIRKRYSPPRTSKVTKPSVRIVRAWCAKQDLPITRAYGGHYFGAEQSVWLDALRATLPESEPARTVALAALIQAASTCAASPGHTAQPFQPTKTAKRFLVEGWERDALQQTRNALKGLARVHAKRKGKAKAADANSVALTLGSRDLVFIDPPYSGVHYSRFYHVLETLARGRHEEVDGTGRYPKPDRRPRSQYSVKRESSSALEELLGRISSRGASAILTFPNAVCSNGLSGQLVREIAQRHFLVEEKLVESRFSTLGGTSGANHRPARQDVGELILLLRPNRASR